MAEQRGIYFVRVRICLEMVFVMLEMKNIFED